MLRRCAIIIGASNVAGQEPLPGTVQDTRNWRAFLKSELGGSWDDEEIQMLQKPTSCGISRLLEQHKGEYIFLAFSGHGEEKYCEAKQRNSLYVCLNDEENSVDVDSITPTLFGTAIFDCCRGFYEAYGIEESLNTGVAAPFVLAQMFSGTNRFYRSSRDVFVQSLQSVMGYPTVRMYSCRRGESAGEDPCAGGFYTTLLIKGANAWRERQKHCARRSVFTTRQAHTFACTAMKQINPEQHPEYRPTRVCYPFAVH